MSISSVKRTVPLLVLLIFPLLLLGTVPVSAQGAGPMGGPYQMGSMYIPGWDPRYSPQWVPMGPQWIPMYVPWWGSMVGVQPMWRMDPRWVPPMPMVPYYNIPWPWGMGMWPGMIGYGMYGMYPGMMGMWPGMMGYGMYGMYPGMMGYGMYGMYPGMMGYGMYGMWPGMYR